MHDSLFGKIVAGEIEADVVHTSDHVVAFRDINPAAPTHILIVPKEHVDSVRSLGKGQAELLGEMFAAAAHLAKANEIDRSGWRLVTNVGPDAGQSVHHVHFHLLGGRKMSWPPG